MSPKARWNVSIVAMQQAYHHFYVPRKLSDQEPLEDETMWGARALLTSVSSSEAIRRIDDIVAPLSLIA